MDVRNAGILPAALGKRKKPCKCGDFHTYRVLKGRISIKIYLWYVLSMTIFTDNIHFKEKSFEKSEEVMYTIAVCTD